MVLCDAFKFVAIVLLGMVASLGQSVAQETTCDVFDVRCPVSNSVWSGSLDVTATSTPVKLCLKLSRSLSVLPGTLDADGCVQLVGVLERTDRQRNSSVIGHYCRSNSAINLLLAVPSSSFELQPDILSGTVSLGGIRLQYYVKRSNDPDEPLSPFRHFSLKRVDACQTN
jgi:hypothetical protein